MKISDLVSMRELIVGYVEDPVIEKLIVTQVGPDIHVEAWRGEEWREVVYGQHGGELNDSDWIDNPWKLEDD